MGWFNRQPDEVFVFFFSAIFAFIFAAWSLPFFFFHRILEKDAQQLWVGSGVICTPNPGILESWNLGIPQVELKFFKVESWNPFPSKEP